MTGRAVWPLGGLLCTALTMAAPLAQASHFKVYGYDTLDAGEAEVVYWTDYVASSGLNMPYFGTTVDRDGLWAHTVELEYGMTDRWTTALYADFEQPRGADFKYIQTRVVAARYRLGEPGERFFDTAIYAEYYLPDAGYGDSGAGQAPQERLETRIILEKHLGAHTLRLNPKFEKVLSGAGVNEGLEFAYGASVYRPLNARLQLGLELYGGVGELVDMRTRDQQHYIVPAATYRLSDALSWNLGVAFGMTDKSDDTVVKSILEWEL